MPSAVGCWVPGGRTGGARPAAAGRTRRRQLRSGSAPPENFIDPDGRDVSIRLTFQGDDWTEEEKAAVIAAFKEFWTKLDVGDLYVFDSASKNETNSPLLNGGVAAITVDSEKSGQSHPDVVAAGEFLSSKNVASRIEALNAVANSINHEIFVHQFKLAPWNALDGMVFAREYDSPRLDPAIRERYGTVADSCAWADPRTRRAFVSGPIPVHPDDRARAQRRLRDQRLSPPSEGPNTWWKLW